MKTTWKRTLAILLSALLVFAALPMAFAGNAGESVNYELSEGVLKITGSGAMTTYAGASAAPWASQKATIRRIIVSTGVTTVGAYAFSGCTSLIDLTLPEGLIKIENNAFDGCTSLRQVTVPRTTTEIGAYAFNNCTSLETVSIMNTSCNIAAGGTTIAASAKIYGYTGSTAETYAKGLGRTFISLNSGTQQVDETPASTPAAGNDTLDQILKTLSAFVQPLLTMFKNLFTQLLANAGNANNTGTTGGTGTTGTTPAATGDAASVFGGILNSFMSFVNNTLASMNGGQSNTAPTGTTPGTTAPAAGTADTGNVLNTLMNAFSGIAGMFGSLSNATATTAPAK